MRIDKFLKVARIIKRRQIAKAFCDAGKVSVNSKQVKASYEVSIDDTIEVIFGHYVKKYLVISTQEIQSKNAKDILVKEL